MISLTCILMLIEGLLHTIIYAIFVFRKVVKPLFKLSRVCLPLEKLVNGKHFSVNEKHFSIKRKFGLIFRKVFSFFAVFVFRKVFSCKIWVENTFRKL